MIPMTQEEQIKKDLTVDFTVLLFCVTGFVLIISILPGWVRAVCAMICFAVAWWVGFRQDCACEDDIRRDDRKVGNYD